MIAPTRGKKFISGDKAILDDFQIIKAVVPQADEIKIYPIADVHFGSILCNEKAWLDFRDKLAVEKNAYAVLVGDLINNNTRSAIGSPFADVVRPREQKRLMVEHLKPLADSGKILAAVSGNHERRSLKDADDDAMYDILAKLDLEDIYRENAAYLHLSIGQREYKGRTKLTPCCAYNIGVTHGSGGGALVGSSINKNERFGYTVEGLDILITGHTHKGGITKPAKLTFNATEGRMILKPFVCVQATCWQEYGGYALQKMFSPVASSVHGGQVLRLSGDRYNKYIKTEW